MPNDHTEASVLVIPPCDFCKELGITTPAHCDGATTLGPWANMCGEHFAVYGRGLGLGVGQRYVLTKES